MKLAEISYYEFYNGGTCREYYGICETVLEYVYKRFATLFWLAKKWRQPLPKPVVELHPNKAFWIVSIPLE